MMIIFLYTFLVVLIAVVVIIGALGVLTHFGEKDPAPDLQGEATAAMCTTNLLERSNEFSRSSTEDFVIEQDMVYTYDSLNL